VLVITIGHGRGALMIRSYHGKPETGVGRGFRNANQAITLSGAAMNLSRFQERTRTVARLSRGTSKKVVPSRDQLRHDTQTTGRHVIPLTVTCVAANVTGGTSPTGGRHAGRSPSCHTPLASVQFTSRGTL
jgi:hypothetical protein